MAWGSAAVSSSVRSDAYATTHWCSRREAGKRAVGAHPDELARRQLLRLDRIELRHVAQIDRPLALDPALHFGGRLVRERLHARVEIGERLGIGRVGHLVLVLGPGLVLLERRLEMEDRAPALDRRDAARGEALAVARAIDLIEDGDPGIARAQEVGVEGVRRIPLDRASGGRERLAEHLPAEDALRAHLRAAAAKQVHLQLFEIEDSQQRVERLGHARLPESGTRSR